MEQQPPRQPPKQPPTLLTKMPSLDDDSVSVEQEIFFHTLGPQGGHHERAGSIGSSGSLGGSSVNELRVLARSSPDIEALLSQTSLAPTMTTHQHMKKTSSTSSPRSHQHHVLISSPKIHPNVHKLAALGRQRSSSSASPKRGVGSSHHHPSLRITKRRSSQRSASTSPFKKESVKYPRRQHQTNGMVSVHTLEGMLESMSFEAASGRGGGVSSSPSKHKSSARKRGHRRNRMQIISY